MFYVILVGSRVRGFMCSWPTALLAVPALSADFAPGLSPTVSGTYEPGLATGAGNVRMPMTSCFALLCSFNSHAYTGVCNQGMHINAHAHARTCIYAHLCASRTDISACYPNKQEQQSSTVRTALDCISLAHAHVRTECRPKQPARTGAWI